MKNEQEPIRWRRGLRTFQIWVTMCEGGEKAWNFKGRERHLVCLENSEWEGDGKHLDEEVELEGGVILR